MSRRTRHGLKDHGNYVRRMKGARAAGNGKGTPGRQGSGSGDISLGRLAGRDRYAFEFPCYPLDIVDFQGHYFFPAEAVTCQS